MAAHNIDASLQKEVTDMLTVVFNTMSEANAIVNGLLDSDGAGVDRAAATGAATTTNKKRTIAVLDLDPNDDSELQENSECKHRRRANSSDVEEAQAESAERQLRDFEHGSAVDNRESAESEDGDSGESEQIPRPFWNQDADADSGPLEYIGRESLSFFRSLLEAGGYLPPRTWQELTQAHLSMIVKFLSHCLDALDASSSALVGPSNWRSILNGQPDPQLTLFMVDALHDAVGFSRLLSRGWEKGKSSPHLKVDTSKVDSTLLVGPEELKRLRSGSSISLDMVGGAAVEHGLAQRSALLVVDESMHRLVHIFLLNRKQWVSTIKAGCGVDCDQDNSRIDDKVRQAMAEFLHKAGLKAHAMAGSWQLEASFNI
jgi:hypothetical protein